MRHPQTRAQSRPTPNKRKPEGRRLSSPIPCTLLLAALLAACAGSGQRRLYDELGGAPGVEMLVEGLLFRIVDNPRIGHHFANSDILRLREKLIEQICAEAQGPCVYSGDDMQIVHTGFNITEADFNALVSDLIDQMQQQRIPTRAQNRLLKRLAPMFDDVVYR